VALAKLLRRWLVLLELFARQGHGPARIDLREYQALHRDLLEAARGLAETSHGAEKTGYEQLERLILPWLTPEVMVQTDREILLDLLSQGRQLERELGARPWLARLWHGSVPLLKVFGPALVVLVVGKTIWLWAHAWFVDWFYPLWWTVRHASDTEWLFIGGLVVTLLAVYIAARVSRSY
jgi:hypothetical protein